MAIGHLGSRCSGNGPWLAGMSAMLGALLLPYNAYTAALPLVRAEWGLSNTSAGFILAAYQGGYLLAVAILLPMTDRLGVRKVLLASTVVSSLGNVGFALAAYDGLTASLFRALAGVGLAGAYMPGMRLVSQRFSAAERGRAVGIYVAAFVAGTAISFAAAAPLMLWLGWRGAYLVLGCASCVSPLAAFLVAKGEWRWGRAPVVVGRSARPWGNAPALMMILAYTAHVWELYGMRAWLAPFFARVLVRQGESLRVSVSQAAAVVSVVVILGALASVVAGSVSDRWGRTSTVAVSMVAGAVCSLTLGWLVSAPLPLLIGLSLFYGLAVQADSAVLSTGVTELVPAGRLGSAMAVQSFAGYGAGFAAPIAFGVVLDAGSNDMGWGLGFSMLGLGALVGPLAMLALRRMPESTLLAGGRG